MRNTPSPWPAPKPVDCHYRPPVQLPITTAEQIRRAGLLAERFGIFHAEAALWAMYLVGDIDEAPAAGHGRSMAAHPSNGDRAVA